VSPLQQYKLASRARTADEHFVWRLLLRRQVVTGQHHDVVEELQTSTSNTNTRPMASADGCVRPLAKSRTKRYRYVKPSPPPPPLRRRPQQRRRRRRLLTCLLVWTLCTGGHICGLLCTSRSSFVTRSSEKMKGKRGGGRRNSWCSCGRAPLDGGLTIPSCAYKLRGRVVVQAHVLGAGRAVVELLILLQKGETMRMP
jgi:hypothetical protein